MKFSVLVSNVFFWIGFVLLVVSIIFFEIGTRYMRKKLDEKRKKADRFGWKFLMWAGIFFGISLLVWWIF